MRRTFSLNASSCRHARLKTYKKSHQSSSSKAPRSHSERGELLYFPPLIKMLASHESSAPSKGMGTSINAKESKEQKKNTSGKKGHKKFYLGHLIRRTFSADGKLFLSLENVPFIRRISYYPFSFRCDLGII